MASALTAPNSSHFSLSLSSPPSGFPEPPPPPPLELRPLEFFVLLGLNIPRLQSLLLGGADLSAFCAVDLSPEDEFPDSVLLASLLVVVVFSFDWKYFSKPFGNFSLSTRQSESNLSREICLAACCAWWFERWREKNRDFKLFRHEFRSTVD